MRRCNGRTITGARLQFIPGTGWRRAGNACMFAGKHYIIWGEENGGSGMKFLIRFMFLIVCSCGLMACATSRHCSQNCDENETYHRKIYLTEQDYLDDLAEEAQAGRREAKPNTESDYIFNIQPDTQKNVYFFDEYLQPKIPLEPAARDYKTTKRLWEKPRRYSPAEYYGTQPAETYTQTSYYEESR